MNQQTYESLSKTRVIEFDRELNEETEVFIRECLFILEEQSHADIKILIKSDGGCTVLALQLVDIIQSLHSRVVGIVIMANSAASAILQGCDQRLAYSSAIMKLHSIRPADTLYANFAVSEYQAEQDLDKNFIAFKKSFLEFKKRHLKLYVKSTGQTAEEVQSWFERGNNTNYLFSAKEAKKLGLIDEVVKRDFRLFD